MASQSTGKTPDCSGEDCCTLVKVIISLGDPCAAANSSEALGHAGLGVGESFYDTYPGGGEYWMRYYANTTALLKGVVTNEASATGGD